MAENEQMRHRFKCHDIGDYIESVRVVVNAKHEADPCGRPPVSMEVIVRYADSAPSDINARVAWAIACHLPAGWRPFGRTWTIPVDIGHGQVIEISATVETS